MYINNRNMLNSKCNFTEIHTGIKKGINTPCKKIVLIIPEVILTIYKKLFSNVF